MGQIDDDEPGVELVRIATAEGLARVLSGMADAPAPSAEETAQMRFGMIAELLAAETEDELWKELPTWSSKDVLGRTFRLEDVHAWASKFTDRDTGARGAFLSCRAIDVETGEVGIFNTSAARLAAKIGWYYLHGKLPVTLTVIKRTETADGYAVLDAERVEAPVA